jgi:hypothetical protein
MNMKKSELKGLIREVVEDWMKKYKAQQAAELRAAPPEVKAVVVAMIESAKKAGLPRNAVSASLKMAVGQSA